MLSVARPRGKPWGKSQRPRVSSRGRNTASSGAGGAEPSWHRRQRRERAAARTLLRVASARDLLLAHHSSPGMPPTRTLPPPPPAPVDGRWWWAASSDDWGGGWQRQESKTARRRRRQRERAQSQQPGDVSPGARRRSASVQFSDGDGAPDEERRRGEHDRPREGEDRTEGLGVLPALPHEARLHPSWVDLPTDPQQLEEKRKQLRSAVMASGNRLRSARDLGNSAEVVFGIEQEYAMLLCAQLLARPPQQRLERQRHYVENVETKLGRALTRERKAQEELAAAQARREQLTADLALAKEMLEQIKQMPVAPPRVSPQPPPAPAAAAAASAAGMQVEGPGFAAATGPTGTPVAASIPGTPADPAGAQDARAAHAVPAVSLLAQMQGQQVQLQETQRIMATELAALAAALREMNLSKQQGAPGGASSPPHGGAGQQQPGQPAEVEAPGGEAAPPVRPGRGRPAAAPDDPAQRTLRSMLAAPSHRGQGAVAADGAAPQRASARSRTPAGVADEAVHGSESAAAAAASVHVSDSEAYIARATAGGDAASHAAAAAAADASQSSHEHAVTIPVSDSGCRLDGASFPSGVPFFRIASPETGLS